MPKKPKAPKSTAKSTPKSDPSYVYWDSCIFLAYLNEEAGRIEVIDRIWQQVKDNKESKIITSAITITEVAFAAYEKEDEELDPDIEAKIRMMWEDPSVLLVEAPPLIMHNARDITRESLIKRPILKSRDAIHVATAVWVRSFYPINAMHTYDPHLLKHTNDFGIAIVEPDILNPYQDKFKTESEEKNTA